MSFVLEFINIKIFLHLFLHLYPFSFICMFISLRLKNARFDDESLEGTNTRDPTIDFEQEAGQTESEEDEDVGFPPELEKIVTQEDRKMGPHQEETKLVDLGTNSGKKEVKIDTGMTAPIREELMALLKNYQDIFAWSYQDMPGLSSNIV